MLFFQAVYVTALFPYVVLVIFFFRAVTLDGAGEGLKRMFTPRVRIFIDIPSCIFVVVY